MQPLSAAAMSPAASLFLISMSTPPTNTKTLVFRARLSGKAIQYDSDTCHTQRSLPDLNGLCTGVLLA
jgi:hypothetical protein